MTLRTQDYVFITFIVLLTVFLKGGKWWLIRKLPDMSDAAFVAALNASLDGDLIEAAVAIKLRRRIAREFGVPALKLRPEARLTGFIEELQRGGEFELSVESVHDMIREAYDDAAVARPEKDPETVREMVVLLHRLSNPG